MTAQCRPNENKSRQQGIHYNNEWCYSSKKILARLDILVFALNNSEIRHTHLRSTKFITKRHQNAMIHRCVFCSQCDDRLEFRSISIRRSIWISLYQNATIHRFKFRFIKMRRYIDLDFASSKCDDTSIWISLQQNATIHQFGFRFIKTSR